MDSGVYLLKYGRLLRSKFNVLVLHVFYFSCYFILMISHREVLYRLLHYLSDNFSYEILYELATKHTKMYS